jgi:hypothetical protein
MALNLLSYYIYDNTVCWLWTTVSDNEVQFQTTISNTPMSGTDLVVSEHALL